MYLPILLASLGADPDAFAKDVRPLLDRYCAACHNAEKKRGGVDLSPYKTQADAAKNPELWEGVAARVTGHEMPPPGAKELPNDPRIQLVKFAKSLAPKDANCKTIASDRTAAWYKGHVMSRRITRAEYDNSIRDLTGLDLKPSQNFPTDGAGGEGFDTVGDALFTSPIHVEKYLTAANQILEAALKSGSASRKKLLVEPGEKPRESAAKTVQAFAERAFRRPLTPEDVERFLGPFDKATARGDAYDAAIRLPLKAVLISPHFLFLVEPEGGETGVVPLGDFPLAARLAAFLWASLPDEELFAAAKVGKLKDDAELKKQVRRMLADLKARGIAENFAAQWLGLKPLGDSIRPDGLRFPEFNDALAEAMRQEVILQIDHVVRENRSVLEWIDADYTFCNERLAKLYELKDVKGDAMRKVSLPDHRRGGVMTTAAVLTVSSFPLRTSPVVRGKWVLEDLLGAKVPPPPPNAGELPASDAVRSGNSFRQQLENHRKKAECAGCHARMDPLGFGLENFDPMGRWRTKAGDRDVDASGQLPTGEAFAGPVELKQLLLKRKGEFVRAVARKLYGYAMGRQIYPFDQCVIDDAATALEKDGYKAQVLFERIAVSYPFRHRFVRK